LLKTESGFGHSVIPLVRNCVEGSAMRGTDERSGSLFSYVDLDVNTRRTLTLPQKPSSVDITIKT